MILNDRHICESGDTDFRFRSASEAMLLRRQLSCLPESDLPGAWILRISGCSGHCFLCFSRTKKADYGRTSPVIHSSANHISDSNEPLAYFIIGF